MPAYVIDIKTRARLDLPPPPPPPIEKRLVLTYKKAGPKARDELFVSLVRVTAACREVSDDAVNYSPAAQSFARQILMEVQGLIVRMGGQ